MSQAARKHELYEEEGGRTAGASKVRARVSTNDTPLTNKVRFQDGLKAVTIKFD